MVDGRDWCRNSKCSWVEDVVSALERLQSDQLCELAAEDLWMTAEVVNEAVGCLLVLGEVTALVEATRSRRVHEEVWRARQLNDKSTRSLCSTLSIGCRITIVQGDILDECKWVFDLVASRVVVDVVRNATLLWRVEDDEVHGTLANSPP